METVMLRRWEGNFVIAKRAVVLCSAEGPTLETSGLKLFTAANLRFQLSL